MSKQIRVRILESESPMELEETVNDYCETLEENEYELVKMTFGNSFNMDFDEGAYFYTPTYTAVIEYKACTDNEA